MDLQKLKLLELSKALQSGDRLTDDQVALLAKVRRESNEGRKFVQIQKLRLMPGEELMDFINAMWTAVSTNRVVLADGSLDAILQGIFDDHVIVMDGNTGRLFMAQFSRDGKGEITFSEPSQVRMTFEPVTSGEEVERRAPQESVVIDPDTNKKWGFLPEFRRRF